MTEMPSNYENLMNSVMKKSTVLSDINESLSKKSDFITSSITDKVNINFNKFLDLNPELRMSTSTYTRTKLDTEFLPKFEETMDIVGNIFIHMYIYIYIYSHTQIYVLYIDIFRYLFINIDIFVNIYGYIYK
jgi:hypothetical protein